MKPQLFVAWEDARVRPRSEPGSSPAWACNPGCAHHQLVAVQGGLAACRQRADVPRMLPASGQLATQALDDRSGGDVLVGAVLLEARKQRLDGLTGVLERLLMRLLCVGGGLGRLDRALSDLARLLHCSGPGLGGVGRRPAGSGRGRSGPAAPGPSRRRRRRAVCRRSRSGPGRSSGVDRQLGGQVADPAPHRRVGAGGSEDLDPAAGGPDEVQQ